MNRSSSTYHEQLYRSTEIMRRIGEFPVTICGAGALGGNMIESLARQGFGRLRVIDRDRVEERNLSTQPYYRTDVGSLKARILANSIFRALGTKIEARTEELSLDNAAKLIKGSKLVVDTFDNSVGRQAVKDACLAANMPCLHVGLSAEYAEIIWNDIYRVPWAANDDTCDYPLARNLVLMAVAIACETIMGLVSDSETTSCTLTLKDFSVRRFDIDSEVQ